MAKFDFANSRVRANWHFKKNFASTFIIFTFISIGLAAIAVILWTQGGGLTGLAQIFLGLALLIESYILALRFSSPKITGENLADNLDPELIELLENIWQAAIMEGIPEIDPEYFFDKFTLIDVGKIIFLRLGIPYSKVEKAEHPSQKCGLSADFLSQITELVSVKKIVEPEDLLQKVIDSSQSVQTYLTEAKVKLTDVKLVIEWEKSLKKEFIKPSFWEATPQTAGIGQDWSYGYTPVLSQCSTDLSRYFQNTNININLFGHAHKVEEIESILAKPSKNNCLLVGEPGVGKKTIVNALAAKLARGESLEPLKYKKIRQIDVARLIGGGTRNEIVARINDAFVEAINAGNIILFIDNFESLLGSNANHDEEVGGVDATQVLLPFLQNSSLRIIGAVSPDGYFDRVRANQGISGAFEKIDVDPATADDTLGILLESVLSVEYQYNVYMPVETLRTVINLSDRYVHDIPMPEKALRLVQELGVNLQAKQMRFVTSEDVEALVSKKTNVPVGEANQTEKDKLLNLEGLLHKRVVGQNEAVKAVADALRRVRSGLTSGKRPAGVFLFLGPTGVGKTETAKTLAEVYFGSEKNMIRLDMSEYQEQNSIERLIGSQNNPTGVLTDSILANPFSLILMDEIEKADKNVLNVFLQVFEDGRLTDARGRTSDFTNAIIIATSNAGSEFIRENVGKMEHEQLKENLVNMLQQEGEFTPEFLNRFDGVIVYRPMTEVELEKVASIMLADINKTLADKRIAVAVAPDALVKLVQLGYDPQFGARPMRRVIQEKVENLLAKKMLSGEVAEGSTLNITLNEIE